MHMSDALVSPAVGGALWAVAAGSCAAAARRVERAGDERLVPLMGVLGAFVFACQMVNFAIPGTGSSGHLAGGLLLSVLLGPAAALLVLTSVLLVQALLFADGGLLALGCNVVNLGVLSSWIAYPLVFRPLAGRAPSRARLAAACVAGGVVALQLGALAVVLETAASGVSTLPLGSFLLLMQPIHLAIGVVEGLATAAVVLVVRRARPELGLALGGAPRPTPWRLVGGVGCAAAVVAGGLSWFASVRPDGLEWATARAGTGEAPRTGAVHAILARAQRAAAVFPDYALPGAHGDAPDPAWPAARASTTATGLAGACVTLGFVAVTVGALRAVRRRASPAPGRRTPG